MRTFRERVAPAAAAAVLLLGACGRGPLDASPLPGVQGEATVTVSRVSGGVRLVNGTGRGVAYVVSNPDWLGLLAICIDPGASCVRLAAGASVVVPHAEIHGWETGVRQAVVRWWHVEPAGTGWRAGEIHEVPVGL